MNRIYRIVWNTTISRWVVASEVAKGKKKTSKGERSPQSAAIMFAATMMVAGGAFVPTEAQAVWCNLRPGPCTPPPAPKPAPAPAPKPAPAPASDQDWAALSHKYFRARSSEAAANPSGAGAISIGPKSVASGSRSIALGGSAVASGGVSIALGESAVAAGTGAFAQGLSASAKANDALAMGYQTSVSGVNSIGIGKQIKVQADNSVALGADARVLKSGNIDANNAVALGSGSVADRAWTVSVGEAGNIKRSITNVASGSEDADAVNVSQLRDTAAALGGGATVNADGTIKRPTYSVGGGTYDNVGDALTAVSGAAGADALDVHYDDANKARVSLGGANGTRVGNLQAGLVDADAVNVSQLKSAGFELDATGAVRNAAVTYVPGSIAAGSPRVVLNAGSGDSTYFVDGDRAKGALPKGTVISNVADGTQDTDAANLGQVKFISQKAIEQGSNGFPPAVGLMSIERAADVGAAAAPSEGSRIDSVVERRTTAYESGNWYLKANGRQDGSGRTGPTDESQVAGAAGGISIGSDATTRPQNGIALGVQALVTSNAPDAVALGAGSVATEANTISVGSPGRAEDTISSYDANNNRITLTNAANTRRVVNMAAGKNENDAVNVSQLKGVTAALGGGASVESDGSIKKPGYEVGGDVYDNVGDALKAAATAGGAGSVLAVKYSGADKSRVALEGTGGTTIANVKAAAADTEAVNLKQLKDAGIAVDGNGAVTNSFVAYDGADKAKVTLAGQGGSTISNVKAGTADMDAVNVKQLKDAGLVDTGGNVQKAVLFNADGTTANANADGKKLANLGAGTRDTDAVNLKQLKDAGIAIDDSGNVSGSFVAYDGADKAKVTLAGQGGSTISNVKAAAADTEAVNLKQLKDAGIAVDGNGAVTNSFVAYDGADKAKVTLAGQGGSTISNVKAGTADMDAVNVKQLKDTGLVDNSGNVQKAVLFNADGTTANANADGKKLANLGAGTRDTDAVNLKQLKDAGIAIDDSGNVSGSFVAYDGADKGKATLAGKEGTTIANVKAAAADTEAVNLKQLKDAGIAVDGNGAVTNSFVAYDGADKAKVTLGGQGGSTISNVKAAAADTEAVNLKQLKDAGIAVDGNGAVTNSFVAYDGADKAKVTLAGQGGSTISNVKAGTADMDAVNVKQLKDTGLVDNSGNVQKAVLFNADGTTANANADGKKLANLAAGNRDSDAVNLKQLKDAGISVDGNGTVTNGFVAYDDGSKDKVTLAGPAGTTISNVKAGVAKSDAVNVEQLQSAGVIDDKGNVRKAVMFDGPSGEANVAGQRIINVKAGNADTDGVNVKQLKDAGLAVDPTTGAVTNSFVAYDTASKGKVTLRGEGGTVVANVKAATANDQAVNLGQLKEAGIAVDPNTGKVTNAAVIYDDASKQIVTFGGGAEGTLLRNVRAGVANTDGANVSQIRGVTEALGGGAGVGSNGQITKPTYNLSGNPYNNVGDALDDLDRRTNENAKAIGDMGEGRGVKYFRANSTAEDASATGADAVAMGPLSKASGKNATAAGSSAQAVADGTLAAGFAARATESNATAVGASALASQTQAVAVGNASSAGGTRSVAVGADAVANEANAASLGGNASATADSALALGAGTRAAHANAVALGAGSMTDRANSVSVGSAGKTRQITSVSAGSNDTDAVNLKQLKDAGISIDDSGNVSGSFVAYDGADKGQVTLAGGTAGTKISNVKAGTADMDAVNVKQLKDTGLVDNGGNVQKAVLFNADGTAANANADGKKLANLAAGNRDTDAVNLKQLKDAGIVVDGNGAVTNGFVAYDAADKAKVSLGGAGGTTISNVRAAASDSEAVNLKQLKDAGFEFNSNGTVINKGITYVPGSIASGAPRVLLEPGVGNSKYFEDTDGDGKGDRDAPLPKGTRISNVADAVQDTDAVNLGQLTDYGQRGFDNGARMAANEERPFALNSDAAQTMAVPANSQVDSIGRGRTTALITGLYYTKVSGRADGTGSTEPTDAALVKGVGTISIGSDSGTTANDGVSLGTMARTTAKEAVALGAGSVANEENTVSVGSAQDNSYETWANDGTSRTTITSKANTRRIVNMAAGQGDNDAVNVGQLRQTTAALGGGANVGTDGSVKGPTYQIGGNTYTTVGDALAAIQATAGTGSPLGVSYDDDTRAKVSLTGQGGTTLGNVKAGIADTDAVNVSQLKASGLVDADGSAIAAVTYDDANKTEVTLGGKDAAAPVRLRNVADAQADSDAVNLKQLKSAGLVDGDGSTLDALVYDSGSAKARATLGGANGTVLANVADGRIAAGSRDAVNGGQIATLRDSFKTAIDGLDGRVTKIETAPPSGNTGGGNDPYVNVQGPGAVADAGGKDNGNVAIGGDTVAQGAGSVAIGNGAKVQAEANNAVALGQGSVADRANSVSVGAPGSERVVTNVADAVRDTDAVNARQMRQSVQEANSYTDSRVNDAWNTVRRDMNDMNRQVNRGIAAASALVNVTPYLPGRTAVNAGVASYRGQTALGIGVSRWSDNGRFNVNAGISAAREDEPIYRVGVGYVF